MPLTVTVSQLNRYLKAVLDEDKKLAGIFVKGEIINFNRHYHSGHCYFTLKDESASVRAVLFKRHADDLRFNPEDGMAVIAQGSVSVYERDGIYQIYVTDMQPDGAGALALAFEQVKARLSAQGLFDAKHKKPLPPYPRRIGVVTSETGAVLQDIRHVLARRYPLVTLVLCPAVVQGRDAPASLSRAMQRLDAHGNCDVIIVGRGGGSAEDLSAFNDEGLARVIFAMKTPVVSAVGHETDYTVCDLVADLRAPTPSAAAELCTPSADELRKRLAETASRLRGAAEHTLRLWWDRLERARVHRTLRTPRAYLYKNQERLDFLSSTMYNKECIIIRNCFDRVKERAALLDSLSPLRVLERGYCAAFRDGEAVTSVLRVATGDVLSVRFRDGIAQTTVHSVMREEPNEKKYDI